MKANVFKMLRSGVCLLLALCMVVGMCPVTAFATESEGAIAGGGAAIPEGAQEINYVSIGDSMANGYGFVGYNQGSNDVEYDKYDIMGDDTSNGEVPFYKYFVTVILFY